MLRFMAEESLCDRVSSSEVAKGCGLKEFSDMAGMRRLQWFGHFQKRGEGEPLLVVRSCQVEERSLRGRLKKSWMKTIAEDMTLLGINKTLASDRQSWREAVNCPTPQCRNPRR